MRRSWTSSGSAQRDEWERGLGALEAKRQRQAIDWMWALIDSGLRSRFRNHPQVRRDLESFGRDVVAGRMTPAAAAQQLLAYLEAADAAALE